MSVEYGGAKSGGNELGGLFNLQDEGRKLPDRVDIIIDSGASVCAAPRSLVGPGRKIHGARTFKTACGKPLSEEGVARVSLKCLDGSVLGAEFHIMGVTRPLASVSKVVSKGSWVVFRPEEDGGSFLWAPDGTYKKLFCKNGVYVLPCQINSEGDF